MADPAWNIPAQGTLDSGESSAEVECFSRGFILAVWRIIRGP